MADELGFEIALDVAKAIGEVYKMSGSLDELSKVWNDTVKSVGQNNIADAIRNQSEKSREALSDMGIPDVEAKFLKLQDTVNKATAGFQDQAGRVVLLKKEISDLEDRLSGIAIKEGTDSEAYERTSVSLARKQLALNKAEQAVTSYAVRMTTAKKALSDYALGIREATAAEEEQAKNRKIDTSKAFTDAPKTLFKGKFAGLAEEFGAYKAVTSSLYNIADAEEEVFKQKDIVDSDQQIAVDKLKIQLNSATAAFNEQKSVVDQLRQEYYYLRDAQAMLANEKDRTRYNKTTAALEQVSDALSRGTNKLYEYDIKVRELNSKLNKAKQRLYDVGKESDKTSSSLRKTGKGVKENNTFLAQLTRSIKNITFYRLVRGAIKSITIAARESANAMAIWSEQFDTGATGAIASFNDNISSIASNLLFARNAIMAAAEPIISALTPAFNMLASAIANAFNMLSHFLSALTGRSFYNKAIKNNVNYANSLKSGSKAQKAFLAGFDELEVVQSSQGGGAGETLGVDPSAMWERSEVEASMKNLTEPFRNAMDNIRSIFDEHAEGLKSAASNLFSSISNLASTIDTSFWDDFFGEGRIGALLFNDALTLLEWTMETLSKLINNFIAPFAGGFLKGFSDASTEIYKFLKTALNPVVDKIKEFFDLLNENPETTREVAENIGYITGVLAGVLTPLIAIKAVLTLIAANPIVVFISVLAVAILYIIKLISMCKEKLDEMYEKSQPMRDAIQGITDAFNFMRDGLQKVVDAFRGANDDLDKESKEIFPGLKDGLEQGFAGFVMWWGRIWDFVIDLFKGKFKIHSPSKLFEGFGENIIQGLRNGIDNFMSKINAAINKIKEALDLSKMKETAKGWGSDFVQGLSDGIRRAKELAKSAADAVAQGIASVLHFSRPDEGVLRDYEQWMPDFMRGLANGIDTNADLVYSSVNNLASGMKSAMTVPTLGVNSVSGQFGNDTGSFTQAQIDANASLADVFWQGCMAVVQAINDNQLEVSIGDDVIGRAATRYNRKQAVINGGA